ncbi:hypothetical protein EVAR_81993_1 [Eumeta japonica]|uniref:Uncharacterized protein n=1 Tax=Eumeta variegata TaxID=151549 RepID=A0A4C1VUY0_EUMVA|nr:hypothetical protein EVAR_81993_1 [Eumeta japonica]
MICTETSTVAHDEGVADQHYDIEQHEQVPPCGTSWTTEWVSCAFERPQVVMQEDGQEEKAVALRESTAGSSGIASGIPAKHLSPRGSIARLRPLGSERSRRLDASEGSKDAQEQQDV